MNNIESAIRNAHLRTATPKEIPILHIDDGHTPEVNKYAYFYKWGGGEKEFGYLLPNSKLVYIPKIGKGISMNEYKSFQPVKL